MSLILVFQRQHPRRPVNDYVVTTKVTTSPTSLENLGSFEVHGHRYDDGWPVLVARFLLTHYPEAVRTAAQDLDAMSPAIDLFRHQRKS
jgi:hypothetical protein